jgi:uncharacterized membrane protein YeaQ/YmgE (transglycosylase-associated protein family)
MGFFATVVVGLVAGWLASLVTKARTSLLTNLILGVIGGFVGGWLSSLLLGENLMSGINITSIAVALAGALVVIVIYRFLFRRGK